MGGGRRNREQYDGRHISVARMWLDVGEQMTVWRGQCLRSKVVVGGRRDRGQYGGRHISGARMWLEVRETEDCFAGAVCKEKGCGWR